VGGGWVGQGGDGGVAVVVDFVCDIVVACRLLDFLSGTSKIRDLMSLPGPSMGLGVPLGGGIMNRWFHVSKWGISRSVGKNVIQDQ